MITAIRFNGVGISAFGSMISGGVSAFPRNAVGFIHALERKLNQQNLSLGSNRRVAVGVENYRLHKGEKNYSSPKMALSKPWKKQGEIANSVLDYEWKCNATVTLLVLTNGVQETDSLQSALNLIIPSMRFANGSIFVNDGFVEVLHGNNADTFEKSVKAVKASRASFFIARDDLIQVNNEFSSFADALALVEVLSDASESEPNSEEPTAKKWKRDQPGWIIPIERGYQAVTKPVTNRPAARHPEIPTVIVTPVIGLGEFVSAKRFLTNFDLRAFWASKSDRVAGFYLFTATSFNN